MDSHRSTPLDIAPGARIELWFTGPDEESLEGVRAELTTHGAKLRTAPWNPLGGRRREVARPWSMVMECPAGVDPTLVAAVAQAHTCRYHADGSYGRWR